MLPKQNRINDKKEFSIILEKGKIFQGPSFGLVCYQEKDTLPARFGFIVSNKISKLATRRNRIRRILREIVKSKLAQIKPGLLFVILVKKNILEKSYKDLEAEFRDTLAKTGSLKN